MPGKVVPHYGEVNDSDRVWFGPMPVTSQLAESLSRLNMKVT